MSVLPPIAIDSFAPDIPVTTLTCATPWESRRTTPIWDGVAPFFASLQIWSTTCSGVVFNHAGGWREYGIAEDEMPLPPLCMRPMFAVLVFVFVGGDELSVRLNLSSLVAIRQSRSSLRRFESAPHPNEILAAVCVTCCQGWLLSAWALLHNTRSLNFPSQQIVIIHIDNIMRRLRAR